MDRLRAMEVFVRVVETGSFSAAARDLRIGQPNVSKLVAGLEDRLQVRLLVRTTRQLHPTEAGQAFYERARRTLEEADEAETAARGLGKGLDGRLRVSAPVTFARLHVIPRIGGFLDAHPDLHVDFVLDDRFVDLMGDNIDVALRAGRAVGFEPDRAKTCHVRATGRCEPCRTSRGWAFPPLQANCSSTPRWSTRTG